MMRVNIQHPFRHSVGVFFAVILFAGCSMSNGGGTQGTGLTLVGGGTTGSGLSSPIATAQIEGTLRDFHGSPMFGIDVTIETVRSTEAVTTNRMGKFAAEVNFAGNEKVKLSFAGPGIHAAYIIEQPVAGLNLLSLTFDRYGKIQNGTLRK